MGTVVVISLSHSLNDSSHVSMHLNDMGMKCIAHPLIIEPRMMDLKRHLTASCDVLDYGMWGLARSGQVMYITYGVSINEPSSRVALLQISFSLIFSP